MTGRTMMAGVLLALGATVGTTPPDLSAQSLLGVGGLGFPQEPLDARARGLGSVGIGLSGGSVLPTDPAGAAGLPVPVLSASYQPSWSTYEIDGVESDLTASRFPLVGVAYPVAGTGGVATLTFSSFLDQNFLVEQEGTVDLAGGETIDVLDQFRSEGGVSALRVGWAHGLGNSLAVALSAGTYLGEARRTMTRFFTDEGLDVGVSPYQTGARWRFTGPTVTAGARWDPSELIRLSGAVLWSGDLHAEPTAGTSEERDIPLPTELRFGASGSLSPTLTANLGVGYADWTGTGRALRAGETVGTAWSFGGGVEWNGASVFGRAAPFRAGYRYQELPFVFDGAAPSESSASAGLGLVLLATTAGVPLAAIDAAYEMGSREAGGFSETFGRATVTIRVAGQ